MVRRSALVDRHCGGSQREDRLEGGMRMRLALRPCLEGELRVEERRNRLRAVGHRVDMAEIVEEHSTTVGSYGTAVLGTPF